MEKDFLKEWPSVLEKLNSIGGIEKQINQAGDQGLSKTREEAKDSYLAEKINSGQSINAEEKKYIEENTAYVIQKFLKGIFNT